MHQLRRAFEIGWWGLFAAWAVGLGFVIRGVDGDTIAGGIANLVAILAPVALFVAIPIFYRTLRRRWRVDEFEDHPESVEEDRFPPDRFARPTGPIANIALVTTIALVLAVLPWGLLWMDETLTPGDVAIGITVSLLLLGGLCDSVVRRATSESWGPPTTSS